MAELVLVLADDPRHHSAIIHSPIALALIGHVQQPVLRIVPLAAVGTDQIAAPGGAAKIVVFCDRERRSATAGD
jgi:hypothetical protein